MQATTNHVQPQQAAQRVLRPRTVAERMGWSRSTLYNRINAGVFPKPHPTGPRTVGWLEMEVDAQLAALAAKRRTQEPR
jgi:predicted DNA-binding transcriptional regulator AlpA